MSSAILPAPRPATASPAARRRRRRLVAALALRRGLLHPAGSGATHPEHSRLKGGGGRVDTGPVPRSAGTTDLREDA